MAIIAATGHVVAAAETHEGFRYPANNIYPRWSPDGGKILFASSRDGNFEIYVMNGDGSDQTRLTWNIATDRQPHWSPDGGRIVFQSNQNISSYNGKTPTEIYVMNADGSNTRRLTTNDRADFFPQWSPTGEWIAYLREGEERFELRLITPDGGDDRAIPFTGDWPRLIADNAWNPSWSPDGQWMAFDAQTRRDDDIYQSDIYIFNISDNALRNVTEGRGLYFFPAWSPEGDRLAVGIDSDPGEGEQWDIAIMNLEGEVQTVLAAHPAYDGWPSWSPDGSQIVFSSRRHGNSFEIYRINSDGTGLAQLTGR